MPIYDLDSNWRILGISPTGFGNVAYTIDTGLLDTSTTIKMHNGRVTSLANSPNVFFASDLDQSLFDTVTQVGDAAEAWPVPATSHPSVKYYSSVGIPFIVSPAELQPIAWDSKFDHLNRYEMGQYPSAPITDIELPPGLYRLSGQLNYSFGAGVNGLSYSVQSPGGDSSYARGFKEIESSSLITWNTLAAFPDSLGNSTVQVAWATHSAADGSLDAGVSQTYFDIERIAPLP